MKNRTAASRIDHLKGLNEFLDSLVIFDNSLLRKFVEAVQAFNGGDWEAVRDLLDEEVAITTFTPPNTIRGKGPVTAYIKNKIGRDQPIFTPIPPVNDDSTTGIVSGNASWEDQDNNVRTIAPITYKFVFSWHVNEQKWFILNLSGSPD
jgi:hypothetical protein